VKQQKEPQDQEPVSEVQWLKQIIEKRRSKPGIADETAKKMHGYFAGIGFSWEEFRKDLPKEGLNTAVWTLQDIFEKEKDKGQESEDKAGGKGRMKVQEDSAPPQEIAQWCCCDFEECFHARYRGPVVVRAGGYCQQCWDYDRSIPPLPPGPPPGEEELKSRRRRKRKKKKPKKGSWIRRRGTASSSENSNSSGCSSSSSSDSAAKILTRPPALAPADRIVDQVSRCMAEPSRSIKEMKDVKEFILWERFPFVIIGDWNMVPEEGRQKDARGGEKAPNPGGGEVNVLHLGCGGGHAGKDKDEREGRIKGGKRRKRKRKKKKRKKMKKGGGKRQSRQCVTTGAITRQTYADVEQQQLQQKQQQQRQLQAGTGSLAGTGEGGQESGCVKGDSQSLAGMRRCRCVATEQYPCWHQGKCSSLLRRAQEPVCNRCQDFEPEHEGASGSSAPAADSGIDEGRNKGYASRPPGPEAHIEGTTCEDCGCTDCKGKINDDENKVMAKEQAEWDRILATEIHKTAIMRNERYGKSCDNIEVQEVDKEQRRLQKKHEEEAEEDEARDNEVKWSLIEAKKRPRPAKHAKMHGQQAKPTPKKTLKAVSKAAMRNSSGSRSREGETQEAMDRRIIAEAVWYGQQEDESVD